ncbi:similar to Saccharomyces cerevisiae YDR361C BCP1 Essential protein involved in nuclear export of Mss4p [Maudiozyma barnettii]|uniref:Protein BCP1 n=1 Tax=Maudiozyma barnettii TaxID=61262 RepID=A0A8H2ZFS1_9SACH|nr:protein-transporting protein BCP1 [Kazachstania barnettii]CAB4253764.1 similar to Saccharomyces cerevisiae YDR361C BCP1 Essential protein involved in nuclear export of Mss4p [Kazachstania barnettii]CAD1781513.1 similar to Saccharomyces cerevisiae YDR361C BCP1 Essential protein involved in nuclear export of Mss4p [Kazachstania barnettii]
MVQALKLSELANRKRRNEEDENGQEEESEIDISSTDSENEGNDDNDEDKEELVNIDFDFYNANPDIDFQALKNLSRQLFGAQESNKIQLSALADLMLASPMTTIKTDGTESDPYCFISFIDYKENRDSDYAKYLNSVNTKLSTFFRTIDNSNDKNCALVISERLINMPPEIVPPLYKITLDDIKNSSNGGKEHFDFYVIVSRKYEVNFDTDETTIRSTKRVKDVEVDYFHEEDRFLEKYAKVQFQSDARKGVISTYMILDHDGLMNGIADLETEISQW